MVEDSIFLKQIPKTNKEISCLKIWCLYKSLLPRTPFVPTTLAVMMDSIHNLLLTKIVIVTNLSFTTKKSLHYLIKL
ncbi:hypothetical protein BLOT_008795 [Blomia tropicalis]|nr:hypothetical protein BLOT_008795 [Blomia tropicalis]